ncbi:TetR/AcrR family transcriptional regulator [Chromobacterium sinusclupearum]|uniref:TetR/AcrR family transcriptional regulator n=1 Tax=Chromobacterium sinusclupearum TaxID=2077146 RepID=A0A2K4MQA9_9NEIS|nr:TetR/AcrR family transcriptional regulator [Chromobacterium sinusclupearum]POA99284.1 TetR/AcrR family transcriptional regulator [Chromobacterium sinusclupearum]
MRYPDAHKTQTRQRIVAMAALRFRAEGLAGVGIANLMADLGLTHGGFYAHFDSKEQLVATACSQALQQLNQHWRQLLEQAAPGECMAALASDYLSPAHRDLPDSGCALAALAGELARQGVTVRQRVAGELEAILATLAHARQRDGQPDSALADLAMMVGSLSLARLIDDAALSQQLLQQARERLVASK